MQEPKSCVLPLDDAPIKLSQNQGLTDIIDFQIINLTRIEGGSRMSYTSTTDNAVRLII